MKLLLDTHVAVWMAGNSPRLSAEASRIIAAADRVYVSSVSVVEIAIKNLLRRRGDPFGITAEEAADGFEVSGLKWLNVDRRHAARVETLPLLHGDPFDRLMAAQALAEGLRLVTHDAKLAAYDPSFILV